MDKRKASVWVVIGLFLLVTTFHVAGYAGSFEQEQSWLLSWPYALAVDFAILLCSYFTKWATTAKPAWVGYFVFTLMSGAMNIGFVEPVGIAAYSYAIFPTLAIALLGWLFRQVDKLSGGKSGGKSSLIPGEKAENSTSVKIPLDKSTFKVEPVESVMEKYGVKRSRAYEIRSEQKAGRWNGTKEN